MPHAPTDPDDGRRDLALVRRILDGDRRPLAKLSSRLECVARILFVRNRRQGGGLDEQELSDLEQDVLAIVWRKLRDYAGLSALEGWVYRICVFEYMNALRRKRRRTSRVAVLPDESPGLEGACEDPDPWEFEDVHDGLRRIGREEARVIRIKHFEGLTFDEIGRRLGISPNTVKARYYRGLEELRPLLADRRPPG